MPMSSVFSSPDGPRARRCQKRRGLGLGQVAHDQPLQAGERAPLEARVLRADGRVLAHHEQPVEAAVERAQHRREVRVVAGDLRQVPEAEVVLRRRRVAEPGLEQRDDVRRRSAPTSRVGRRRCRGRRSSVSSCSRGARHVQVARQQVVERRDVGRALDRRVAAQRQDAAARPADVAEQELQDRAGADHLHAGGVLRPADRVDRAPRALAARVARSARRRPRRNCSRRDAADALDHLGRVAREVALAGSGTRSAGAGASRRA